MKKLDILNAIAQRLATITTSNGYLTNIGSHSSYWQDWDFEYGEVGACTFRDLEEEIKVCGNYQEFLLLLEIEAVAYSENLLTVGCNLQSDLTRAIGVDPTWGGNVIKSELKGTEKQITTEGKRAIGIVLKLDITYREPLWERVSV